MMVMIGVEGVFAGLVRCNGGLLGRADIVTRLGWAIVGSIFGSIVGFVDGLVSGEIPSQVLLDLVEGEALSEIVARASELRESAAEGSCEFRHSLGSENQKRHDENQNELQGTDSEHRMTI
jgi:hypothetical protein